MLTRDEILARALSAVGHQTVYALGKGGRKPLQPHPADQYRRLDCSGYIAWALGVDRYQPGKISGDWISTSSIVRDADRDHRLFIPADEPEPGDLVVYPDRTATRTDGSPVRLQGHVGILVEVPDKDAPGYWDELRVVHCSSGNYRRTGDAIQVTNGSVFARRGQFVRWVG